jgi:hypothetical protein
MKMNRKAIFTCLAILIVALVTIPENTRAQYALAWESQYVTPFNGLYDSPSAITTDSRGNVYITGAISQGQHYDCIVLKYNGLGEQQWVVNYQNAGQDRGFAIVVDSAGFVYVAGETGSNYSSTGDALTMKISPTGQIVWASVYNGPANHRDALIDISVDQQGNVYVAGIRDNLFNPYVGDMCTIKYNSNGQLEWANGFNGSENSKDEACGLSIDGMGNVYVSGTINHSNPDSDIDIGTIKYDSAGQQIWSVVYTSAIGGLDEAADLELDHLGNVIVVGTCADSLYNREVLTLKYNSLGEMQWESHLGAYGEYIATGRAVAIDDFNNIYTLGEYDATPGYGQNLNTVVIKNLSNGFQQWVNTFDGWSNTWDYANSIVTDHFGNIYTSGLSRFSLGSRQRREYVIRKLDHNGINQFTIEHTEAPLTGYRRNLALDANNNIYLAGVSNSHGNQQILIMRYNQLTEVPVAVSCIPLNPPVQIPAQGGAFEFSITITNLTTIPQEIDVWTKVQTSWGFWYQPIPCYTNLNIPASAVFTRLRMQYVPGITPPGIFKYNLFAGIYPDIIYDESNFTFQKMTTGEGDIIQSWENFEVTAQEKIQKPSSQQVGLINMTPNPFNVTTTISYEIDIVSHVSLKVYDVSCRMVADLVNGMRDAGSHQVAFDGSRLASGMYFVRMQAGSFSAVKKIMLVK